MSAMWQQIHSVFASAYLPRDFIDTFDDPKVDVNGYWVIQLRNHVVDSPALQMAVAAFAASHIARENKDEALGQQSREMYLRALNHLRTALKCRETHLSEETLATCLVMALYEMSESPATTEDQLGNDIMLDASTPYRTHLSGAIMIAEMRGPDANKSPLSHSLFQSMRRSMMLGSLMTYQPTFLTRPEWRERPWAIFPKNNLDTCIDVVLDIPLIMRQCIDAVLDPDETARINKLNAGLNRCNELEAFLQDWFAKFEQRYPQPMYWSTPSVLHSHLDNEEQGKMFPTSYQFATFTLAHLLITYWTGVMVLSKLSMVVNHRLSGLYPPESDTSSAQADIDRHSVTMIRAIQHMCQSAEYFLDANNGRLGAACANSYLQGCWSCLRGGPAYWQRLQSWVEEMTDRMRDKLHLPARDYARSQPRFFPN